MSYPTRIEQPRSVEFDVHRWYTIIIVVDRFGVTRRFHCGQDPDDGGEPGFWEIDQFGKDVDG